MKITVSRDLLQASSKKNNNDRLLTKQFFPFYLTKIKHILHVIHGLHPKTAHQLLIKLLSIAIKKKLSDNAIAFYKKGIKKEFCIGHSVFYTYTYGNGPLILMLHGWCSNGARWRVYVDALVSRGYKIMVVDAPGHGTAPGRFLSIFQYAKGIQAILASEVKWHTVITHSIAGLTAIAALGHSKKQYHPTKFIMMNTFATATAILKKFSGCLGVSNKVVAGAKKLMSVYTSFPLHTFSISKHINNICENSLLVYDTADPVVPKSEAEYIIKHVPSLNILKTEGLGHNLKSNRIVEQVVSFIEKNRYAPDINKSVHMDLPVIQL